MTDIEKSGDISNELSTPIRFLKGVGEVRASYFNKLGVQTVGDLIEYFPRSYEERGNVKKVADVIDGEVCSLLLTITELPVERISHSGLRYTKVCASDDSGGIEITFFNQRWVVSSLTVGRKFRFYGKISRGLIITTMLSPVIEAVFAGKKLADIYTIYPLTKGITSKTINAAVAQVGHIIERLPDILPTSIIDEYGFPSHSAAVHTLHFPSDMPSVVKARRRLAFEELLLFQLALLHLKNFTSYRTATPMSYKNSGVGTFFQLLPFQLTDAQQRAVKEIFSDLTRSTPMSRLLQGDVGSGKTVIAAAAIFLTARNGMQSALMAPTEILAIQHCKTLRRLFEHFDIRVELLTGSVKGTARREILAGLADGSIDVIVGTNALIQETVVYKSLGLSVADEQHRFGVLQRACLVDKGTEQTNSPHTLIMSATPIPRSLSLVLYGDLDVTVIDTLPPGRKPIQTYAVGEEKRSSVYEFIKEKVAEGRQAYIICPLIDENEGLENRISVNEYQKKLIAENFDGIPAEVLHGKVKPKQKDEIIRRFAENKTKILVSTTVVEVGVDIPNATVMLIENAECFGLSQLHQLRGRVGRGSYDSYCILMSETGGARTRQRLDVLCRTNNGFEIADADLKQRGPGDFFGERQSGELIFKIAGTADMKLIEDTKRTAAEINKNQLLDLPEYAPLKSAVNNFFDKNVSNNIFN